MEVLIVTRTTVLQEALEALLRSLPEIEIIQTVNDLAAAYTRIERSQPRIALLDMDLLGRHPESTLEKIHLLSPGTRRAVMVNDVESAQLLPDHAEAVLVKGVSPSAITQMIRDLLKTKDGSE